MMQKTLCQTDTARPEILGIFARGSWGASGIFRKPVRKLRAHDLWALPCGMFRFACKKVDAIPLHGKTLEAAL